MASLSLVAKYLTSDQKRSIALSLAQDLNEAENAEVLCQIMKDLEPEVVEEVYPFVLRHTETAAVSGNSESFSSALRFLENSTKLHEDTLASVLQKLQNGAASHFNFVLAYQKYLVPSNGAETSKEDILALFAFLSQLFTTITIPQTQVSGEVDRILCLYLGHKDDEIASACSQLTRWRVKSLVGATTDVDSAVYLWNIVFGLENSATTRRNTSNAYIMWLRILIADEEIKLNSHFQTRVLNTDSYWQLLQKGLVSNSHEIRKFCLSILQLSLKAINSSFETELLSWDLANSNKLMKEWSRYTTLFEILGIDTSLHQTQAAVHDILSLINAESLIHPSWGFCLLCTGFQASMDSVRRFSAHVLLSIDPEHLHLIKYALPYFENTFLPYMMLSYHFAVRSTDNSSNAVHCEYGEKLAEFLCNTLRNLKTQEEFDAVSYSILNVLDKSKESFDAVRVFVTMGLIRGMEGKRVMKYGKHDLLIVKLFDNYSEGDLFRKVIQTQNLRLILNFNLDSFSEFVDLLGKFVNFNRYELLFEHMDLVVEYLQNCGISSSEVFEFLGATTSENDKVLCACIAESYGEVNTAAFNEGLSNQSDSFFAKLIGSGFSFDMSSPLRLRAEGMFQNALSGTASDDIYESLSSSNVNWKGHTEKTVSVIKLWNTISSDVVSDDYGVLLSVYFKWTFLNNVIKDLGFGIESISLNSILNFKSKIFCNSKLYAKTVGSFYKLKDDVFGQYHRLLSLHIMNHNISDELFTQLIPKLNFGSTHFVTLFSICQTMKSCFDGANISADNLKSSVLGLRESWEELDCERLKLNEKELHVLFIQVFFHPFVLRSSVKDPIISETLLVMGQSVLVNACGRKGLLPQLAKSLIEYQVSDEATFAKLPFIPELLVHAVCHRQLKTSAFKIEAIIGEVYDKYLSSQENSNIYEEVYGEDEVAARVWILATLNSISTSALAKSILDFVFDKEDQFMFLNVINKADGAEEHFRSQLARSVLSVVDKVDPDTCIELYLDHFVNFIEEDPSPLVRVYFEWIIANLLLQKPQTSDRFFKRLVQLLETQEAKPTLITIYERILFLMIKSLEGDTEVEYLTRFLTIIIPAASTNKAVTRHFSMSLATSVYTEVMKKNLKIDEHLFSIVENMYNTALAQDAFGQFRNGDALLWDIVEDMNLVNISGGLLLRLNDREVDFITKEEFNKYLTPTQLSLLNHPVGDDKSELWISALKDGKRRELQESNQVVLSPLQTKSGAWSSVMDVDEAARGSDIVRSDLIVVASLVDKPPNLGGICRLCDVLGAGTMTIHDSKVKAHPQFKSVAVTADYWMPMIEVKPEQIVEFLKEQKAKGYTLIGLEQTDKSVVLDSELQFPKKSLILLGREKEGIPGELLAELDFCVEIKQVGVVRSMNIQTATAVIVHAYSSQNC